MLINLYILIQMISSFIINIITEKQIETKFGTENTLILTYHFWKLNEKNNKGKTIKKRIQVQKINETLFGEHKAFVDEAIGEKLELFPRHWNRFQRVTFVHKRRKERLTIDVNFRFQDIKDTKIKLGDMVIAEVKQEKKTFLQTLFVSSKKNESTLLE